MQGELVETKRVADQEDLSLLRHAVKKTAQDVGLSLVNQTKLVTAVSELARNAIVYGGGGEAVIEKVDAVGSKGVRVTISDSGPGIEDLSLALQDGFTSGGGMGLGLPGAKRLVDEFDLRSAPGSGTTVVILKWN